MFFKLDVLATARIEMFIEANSINEAIEKAKDKAIHYMEIDTITSVDKIYNVELTNEYDGDEI